MLTQFCDMNMLRSVKLHIGTYFHIKLSIITTRLNINDTAYATCAGEDIPPSNSSARVPILL